ncbi:hypothetical protein ADICYQ_5914 [Cyclobacterium qasimii M12-11B]|uniref:Uncharacterized protein n=1 Tax=Cyclobacterium qasimii M12-11B TaxID=641524 RepID=S7WE83_9BACT|nr:hypothetical protein ADICYQ_5914 [Cyclobacterium qasimii M12-11B]
MKSVERIRKKNDFGGIVAFFSATILTKSPPKFASLPYFFRTLEFQQTATRF